MPVLGHDAHPGGGDLGGRGTGQFLLPDEVLPLARGEETGQHQPQFALSVAFDAGDADDFAAPQGEGEIVEAERAGVVPHGQPIDLHHLLAERMLAVGLEIALALTS